MARRQRQPGRGLDLVSVTIGSSIAGPLVALLLATWAPPAAAASKTALAVLGDPAPGGGVFAGPGFTGWPAAAGNGWVAFRGEISDGGTTEAIVVARMTAPLTRIHVAGIGEPAPGGGTFRQFIGRPAVNANGDVAFVALLRPDVLDIGTDPNAPAPAGVFRFRSGALESLVRSGQATAAGTLDLLGALGPEADGAATPEHSPAMNDAGDVAFLSAVVADPGPSGAIFVVPSAGEVTPAVRLGERFDGGEFVHLGPPALNNLGLVAFRGTLATDDPADDDGVVDGIFTAGGGTVSMIVREGLRTMPLNLPLREFEDPLTVNDYGSVAFLGGPLFDDEDAAPTGDERSPGVLVWSAGVVTVVAHPGRSLGEDRMSGFRLGASGGSQLVPPAIAPDGKVAFFVSLNGGAREAIALWDGRGRRVLVYTGGTAADDTPAGGIYRALESAPAIDAALGVAFLAGIAGGRTSAAIVYQPSTGDGLPIVVGDAAPTAGFFAGQPFSAPLLNDRGDVVFVGRVARGPASVGLFRARDGRLHPIVRAGDRVPSPNGVRILDLLGEPSMNQHGAVAFAALVEGGAVGLYVAEDGAIRPVAVTGEPAPGEPGTLFRTLSFQPALNDEGEVAFRGTTLRRDPDGEPVRREGIFFASGTGTRAIVWAGDPSPAGAPFFKLRNPALTNLPNIAFRATLGDGVGATTGLFLADLGAVSLVALEEDPLAGGVMLSGITRDPSASGAGDLAFLATRSRPLGAGISQSLGTAILRRTDQGLGLVVAQRMPGPAGGTFSSLGTPTLNAPGHVAFRGSFLPQTGGVGGVFLATDEGLEPYLALGEATPAGGLFAAFASHSAPNVHDDLAFTAAVSSGATRHGIFLASRSRLEARALAIRVGRGHSRDRIRVELVFQPGRLSDGFDPETEPVRVAVADGRGPLWSVTIRAGQLERRRKAFVSRPRRGETLAERLAVLRLRPGRHGTPALSAVSAPLDLTQRGSRPLEPPFSVTLEIGDDAGTRSLPCLPRRGGGVRCASI